MPGDSPIIIDHRYDTGLTFSGGKDSLCSGRCTNLCICRRPLSNGVIHFYVQCRDCGDGIRSIKSVVAKSAERHGCVIRDWDQALADRHREKLNRHWSEKNALVQVESRRDREEWWAKYRAYLESPDWKRRRQKVLKRDQYTCQGCLTNPAVLVHHLTYEHMGNEFAFELVSMCDACHNRFHEKDGHAV